MAIRKSAEEVFVVAGARDDIIRRCQEALTAGGFSGVEANTTLYQVVGIFRSLTTWGEIIVTLLPEGTNTRVAVRRGV